MARGVSGTSAIPFGVLESGIQTTACLAITREIHFRLFQKRLITLELSLILLQVRLVRSRVDVNEGIAAMHDLTLDIMNRNDLPVYLAVEIDSRQRCDRSDCFDILTDVALAHSGCSDVWRWHLIDGDLGPA